MHKYLKETTSKIIEEHLTKIKIVDEYIKDNKEIVLEKLNNILKNKIISELLNNDDVLIDDIKKKIELGSLDMRVDLVPIIDFIIEKIYTKEIDNHKYWEKKYLKDYSDSMVKYILNIFTSEFA